MAKKKSGLTQASRADIRMSVAHKLGFDKFDSERDCEWNERTHDDEFDTLCGFTQEGVGTLRIIISDRNSLTWLIDASAHFGTLKDNTSLNQATYTDMMKTAAHQLGFDKFDGEHDCEWTQNSIKDNYYFICDFKQDSVGSVRFCVTVFDGKITGFTAYSSIR